MLTLRRLSRATRCDFLSLFDEITGKDCYCVAWHRKSWAEFDSGCPSNRELRTALIDAGRSDGFLFYDGQHCIAWCQATRADDLPNLAATFPQLPLHDRWAITCLRLRSDYRGKGLGTEIVRLAVDALVQTGITSILAFPHRYEHFNQDEVWTGTVGMFQRCGFDVIGDDAEGVVMEINGGQTN